MREVARSRILVVDDESLNRRLIQAILAPEGHELVHASNGEQALARVAAGGIDLVLLDVMMPGLSGIEVCERIRADHTLIPIVVISALTDPTSRTRAKAAGADDFLTKPINAPELLARVKSLLRIKAFHDTVQTQASELSELNTELEKRVQEQLGELQRLAQLKRFFPQHLAERIVSGDVDDPLATHRREVTVVVLDLRGFTAFADTSEPEEVMSLLRRYHQVMGQLIQAHGGTLEQFSGASMLVIFNDPVISEDPAGHAVRMALEMQARFDDLMVSWRKRGHEIALGIGMSHGYATIGAIGDDARIAYGAIGRVTNIAARLSTEAPAGQILASAPVYELVEASVDAAASDQVNLSGFARPVTAYRIRGLKRKPADQGDRVWPLKIYTLGQFALLRDGQPVVFSRKVQKRPLDLLKVLIAHGAARADVSALVGALWPDAEGDAAKVSFDSNLHRLRKLIDIEDILPLHEGRLSLDPARCWVDVWAFEELVNRVDAASHQPADAEARDGELVKELLRLYAGHFIEKESQDPWAASMRDRLRAKFVRAVTTLGSRLEQRKQWESAIMLYSRALELDNLAEGLYRRLMVSYRELGETAEALKVYRRCRDMLSIVLSINPSPETEAIRATLN